MKKPLWDVRLFHSCSLALAAALLVFMTAIPTAWADTDSDMKKLDIETTALDKDAGEHGGSAIVLERLEKEFGVTSAEIDSLRDKKLGFGEIAIIFSLARKMPGGITDANISTILAMRQGPPKEGWGEVAKKLGFKLGPTVSGVKKFERSSHQAIGKAERGEHESIKGEERGEGMRTAHERPDRPFDNESIERSAGRR